jgi:tryptophan 2,3-dioxygenase
MRPFRDFDSAGRATRTMRDTIMDKNSTTRDGQIRTSGTALAGSDAAVYNARGIIAEHYRDLQGLAVLEAARATYPLPRASDASTVRAVFQSVELALLNLADVTARAAADLERRAIGPSLVKLAWARGFHRILVRLSLMPSQLGIVGSGGGRLRVVESPAFAEYIRALDRFDAAVLARVDEGHLDLEGLIGDKSLDSPAFHLLHLTRVSNHEATIWECNLADVPVPADVPSYTAFVVSEGMRNAVYDRVLAGDTYFTQFRGLHQIPETLGEEANDRLESAIRAVRAREIVEALGHLRCVNVLTDGMLAAVPPMADNLTTSDYHQIRENLGLTSGSHSVCLRFHLFTDLYSQLWEAVARNVLADVAAGGEPQQIEDAIRHVDRTRFVEKQSWHQYLLLNECLALRGFVTQWRDEHLHMPRNNLGGGHTKSLAGAPEALTAVQRMRQHATASDPMLPLARARGLVGKSANEAALPLRSRFESDESLDSRILLATGQVTQTRFVDVQERLGFFANRCPFTPPAPRTV